MGMLRREGELREHDGRHTPGNAEPGIVFQMEIVMAKAKRKSPRKWSGKVTRESHALALEPGVFKKNDPDAIASSLKRSADKSTNRKTDPYRSALSMLNFYINRAGRNLPAGRKKILTRAKTALRKKFHEK
jgi:hypothetical protein